jgi:hypothetical protein
VSVPSIRKSDKSVESGKGEQSHSKSGALLFFRSDSGSPAWDSIASRGVSVEDSGAARVDGFHAELQLIG